MVISCVGSVISILFTHYTGAHQCVHPSNLVGELSASYIRFIQIEPGLFKSDPITVDNNLNPARYSPRRAERLSASRRSHEADRCRRGKLPSRRNRGRSIRLLPKAAIATSPIVGAQSRRTVSAGGRPRKLRKRAFGTQLAVETCRARLGALSGPAGHQLPLLASGREVLGDAVAVPTLHLPLDLHAVAANRPFRFLQPACLQYGSPVRPSALTGAPTAEVGAFFDIRSRQGVGVDGADRQEHRGEPKYLHHVGVYTNPNYRTQR